MAKSLNVSKQILIANHKANVDANSGIEAGFMITPINDGAAGLKIYARIRPDVNRVDLLPKTALTQRGIIEAAAQDKYMADLAAIKTFFGLVNNGDNAALIGMHWIELDAGGVFWNPAKSPFPQPAVFSVSATEGVTEDVAKTHKYLNYFNPATGDFGVAPVKAAASDPTTPETFWAKWKNWIIGGGIAAGAAALAYALWPKKKRVALPRLPKRRR